MNKQYCILNEQYSKETYLQKIALLKLNSRSGILALHQQFEALRLKHPHRASSNIQTDACIGDNLQHIKNGNQVFDGHDSEDVCYLRGFYYVKDSMDGYAIGSYNTELCYEGCVIYGDTRILFSTNITHGNNIFYSDSLFSCSDCFGCVGLRNKQYCILNKQYTKELYEELVSNIIEVMIKTGEWGEFFPPSLSPFGYNETVANEYYPLRSEYSTRRYFNWSDFEPPKPDVEKIIPASKLPDTIKDIPDDILNWAIECEVTKRPFRIIKQELAFYREHNLPIPRRHPDQRHKDRMALRNPRKLYNRTCMKCTKPIQTTYAPDRPEIIYCEECYLKEVY
jgi:hypothetical protein